MIKEIIGHLMGPTDPAYFMAAFIAAMVGIVMSLLYSAANRDQSKESTPDYFSWKYLLSNNFLRIVFSVMFTILAVIVTLRFTPEILGVELNMFIALGIGLSFDRLSSVMKDKGLFNKKLPGQ